MGKYLHKFDTESEFQAKYSLKRPVTAITIDDGMVSPGCEGDWTETHDFDGTYVLGEEKDLVVHNECSDEDMNFHARTFKNGDRTLYDIYDELSDAWSSEVMGAVQYCQDILHAGQAGDVRLHVSGFEYGNPVYYEPWVSYTTYDSELVKIFSGNIDNVTTYTGLTFEFVEEVDEIAPEIG
jgi:hypothetical protein